MCGLIGWLGLLLLFGLFVLDGGLGWRGGLKAYWSWGVCVWGKENYKGTSKTSSSGGILGIVCVREKQTWLI